MSLYQAKGPPAVDFPTASAQAHHHLPKNHPAPGPLNRILGEAHLHVMFQRNHARGALLQQALVQAELRQALRQLALGRRARGLARGHAGRALRQRRLAVQQLRLAVRQRPVQPLRGRPVRSASQRATLQSADLPPLLLIGFSARAVTCATHPGGCALAVHQRPAAPARERKTDQKILLTARLPGGHTARALPKPQPAPVHRAQRLAGGTRCKPTGKGD